MNASGDGLLNRLRTDIELKAEVIKALRSEREQISESARTQAAFMAELSADVFNLVTNIGLLIAEGGSGTVQRAVEQLKAVCADLVDYTAASTGQLALARKPVHVRQLLSQLASRYAVDLRVGTGVPERVIADQVQLSKVLAYFLSAGLEAGQSVVLVVEVVSDAAGDSAASPRLTFALHQRDDQGQRPLRPKPPDQTPLGRLRTGLAAALCEIMGATLTPLSLTLPTESAADQAHTGMFRLAVSDAQVPGDGTGTASPAPAPAEVAHPDDASIDLMYLDRQLGSLAPVILARTAPAFIAQAQRRMTDLHVAHEFEELDRLRNIAQAWKGSALSVGARGLAAVLEAIEKQAAAGRLPGPGSIWQVRSALDRVVHALESYGDARGGRHERA
jgi:Hpt domain-containing protein